MANKEDVTYTAKTKVSCTGADELIDHPTVYFEIDKDKREVSCPYCNKLFKLTE